MMVRNVKLTVSDGKVRINITAQVRMNNGDLKRPALLKLRDALADRIAMALPGLPHTEFGVSDVEKIERTW